MSKDIGNKIPTTEIMRLSKSCNDVLKNLHIHQENNYRMIQLENKDICRTFCKC